IAPFAYGGPGWVPLAGNWDGNAGSRVLVHAAASGGSAGGGGAAGGNDVTLTAGGPLIVGTGAGEGIAAGVATVDLNVAGAAENPGSAITAAGLRLRGVGAFALEQGNDVTTFAAATAGGPVHFTDVNDL